MSKTARPLVVWTTCHPWIQEVVAEVQPPEFDVEFLDIDDPEACAHVLPQATAVVCLTMTNEQARLLQQCRLVMHNGVGYDGIALDTLEEMGIPVAVTPTMTPEGVAEHMMMLILALSKQLPAVQTSMRSGDWNMLGWRQGSHNLAYKTLGIVGVGRIGSRVARVAHAFGCKVIYTDVVDIDPDLVSQYEMEKVSLDELISTADIVTLHVPLTDVTRKMMGADQFAAMKPGSIFINTCRGETYDIDALHEAVISGHLFGAGIDVFDPEPPPVDHPILQLDNVICTPHIASGTVERQYAINRAQFLNIQTVLAGNEPNDRIR